MCCVEGGFRSDCQKASATREANDDVHRLQLHMENGRKDEKDAVADIENTYMATRTICTRKNNYSQYYQMSTYNCLHYRVAYIQFKCFVTTDIDIGMMLGGQTRVGRWLEAKWQAAQCYQQR
jgi:hypothetical protein